MGLWANYLIALGPGMGLNAFFTYTVVMTMGYTWQVGLGAVFLSGLLFFALSIFRIREWIIHSIPLPLRTAISAGIGLFLALIALKNTGMRSSIIRPPWWRSATSPSPARCSPASVSC